MVKTIIACSDIHIRNLRRQEEYTEQLKLFLEQCREIVAGHESSDEVRIVIAGDLAHSKLELSAEAYTMLGWFLGELNSIAKTIFIAGNHDLNMSNLSRVDPLSSIMYMGTYGNVMYLDKELNYQSGCIADDNIVWCLYSSFDGFAKPDIQSVRINAENGSEMRFVGLYHGELNSAKTDTGYACENGLNADYFEGLDFGILGHIHKHQCVKHDGIPLVYCSSLIQQDAGENVSGHGYVVWDVDKCEYEFRELENKRHGFYVFSIEGEDDVDNDSEEIVNL